MKNKNNPSHTRSFPKAKLSSAIIGALAINLLIANSAFAQEPGTEEEQSVRTLDSITVTATRRAKSVQEVPLNIAAIDGETLDADRITNLADIGRTVPGLYVLDQGGRTSNQIIVRGLNADPVAASEALGNGGGGTVATYVGEIPLYVDLRLDDMERVEVLMGPQGTLYGAGTMGGAIRFIPRRPEFDEKTLQLRTGAYVLDHSSGLGSNAGFTVNMPFSDTFAMRASYNYADDPGFIDYNYLVQNPGFSDPEPDFNNPADVAANLTSSKDANWQKVHGGRLAFRWRPNDVIDATLTHYFQNQEDGGRSQNHLHAFGTGRYESAHRFLEPNDRTNELTALELTADLGFAELTSATGFSSYDEVGQRDQTDLLITLEYSYEAFPSFAAFTREDQDESTFNQELRLVSKSEGPVSWIVGAFYNELESEASSREFTPEYSVYLNSFLGTPIRPDELEYYSVNQTDLKERAVYGEVTWEANDKLQFTFGARWYDYDLKTRDAIDFPLFNTAFGTAQPNEINLNFVDGGQSDDGMLYKFNTSYKFAEDFLGYFTYSEGYRIGNSNGIGPCPSPLPITPIACALPDEMQFFPDQTKNYEIGFRSQWFERRLTLNGAVFFIDWTDPQLAGTTDNAALPITLNGEGAESKGLEVSFDAAITDAFSLRGSYAYTKAELSEDAPALLSTIVGPGFSPRIDVDGLAGDRLPGSPEQQATLFGSYVHGLTSDLDLRFDYGVTAIGNVLTRTGMRADGERLPGFALHSAAVTLTNYGKWNLQLYADNLFDKYAETGVRSSTPYIQTVADENGDPVTVRRYYRDVLRPREVGMRFTYNFNL